MINFSRSFQATWITNSCCSCRWGGTVPPNCGQQRACCSSLRWYISMENHGGMTMSTEESCWFIYYSSLAILPAVIWYQAGGMGERDENLVLLNIFVHTCKWFLTCHSMLRHETGVLRIITVLKNLSLQPGLNPQTLDPVASTVTITPDLITGYFPCNICPTQCFILMPPTPLHETTSKRLLMFLGEEVITMKLVMNLCNPIWAVQANYTFIKLLLSLPTFSSIL
jgi:hypothetical protein